MLQSLFDLVPKCSVPSPEFLEGSGFEWITGLRIATMDARGLAMSHCVDDKTTKFLETVLLRVLDFAIVNDPSAREGGNLLLDLVSQLRISGDAAHAQKFLTPQPPIQISRFTHERCRIIQLYDVQQSVCYYLACSKRCRGMRQIRGLAAGTIGV